MKSFILKIILFSLIVVSMFLVILTQANGYTDPFYIRFTTPQQKSLILGTSRAAQALQPSIFKEQMNLDIFNYAFTVSQSSYGPIYLESIKKKLLTSDKKGTFIVTVDPWSISSTTNDPNDVDNFRENNLALDNTTFVNVNPNIEYLIQNLSGQYYDILLNKYKSSMFLHDDGWLDVSVEMDAASVKKRTDKRIADYEKNLLEFKYSSLRFQSLKTTINYLKNYGNVYLVRLPIHKEMMKIEEKLMPDFNTKIETLLPLTNGYYDMTPLHTQLDFTDGNHLYKASGKKVTMEIIKWIQVQ